MLFILIKKLFLIIGTALLCLILSIKTLRADLEDLPEDPNNSSNIEKSNSQKNKETSNLIQNFDINTKENKSIKEDNNSLNSYSNTKTNNQMPQENNQKNLKKSKKNNTTNTPKKPIYWQAQGLKANKNKSVIELIKDVRITQDDLTFTSDSATIYLDNKNNVTKVVAEGNVKISKKPSNKTMQSISARGEKAIYDNIKRRIVLMEKAILWRGNDLMKGNKISFDIDTEWIYVDKVEGLVNSSKESNNEQN